MNNPSFLFNILAVQCLAFSFVCAWKHDVLGAAGFYLMSVILSQLAHCGEPKPKEPRPPGPESPA